MADEISNQDKVVMPPVERRKSVWAYTLYKLDRTLAILGIILIPVVTIVVLGSAEVVKDICLTSVGGLIGYIGGRGGK
jgi:hypothetical protein